MLSYFHNEPQNQQWEKKIMNTTTSCASSSYVLNEISAHPSLTGRQYDQYMSCPTDSERCVESDAADIIAKSCGYRYKHSSTCSPTFIISVEICGIATTRVNSSTTITTSNNGATVHLLAHRPEVHQVSLRHRKGKHCIHSRIMCVWLISGVH